MTMCTGNEAVRLIASDEFGADATLEGIAYNEGSDVFYLSDSTKHVVWELSNTGIGTIIAGTENVEGDGSALYDASDVLDLLFSAAVTTALLLHANVHFAQPQHAPRARV